MVFKFEAFIVLIKSWSLELIKSFSKEIDNCSELISVRSERGLQLENTKSEINNIKKTFISFEKFYFLTHL